MSQPSYPLKQIVEVEWLDSASRGRWDYLENYQKEEPSRCTTCGYLVTQDKNKVIVALSQGKGYKGPDVLDSIVIPRGCITKIRRLK